MLTDTDYVGLTLIGEVRGEPIEGIIGVACVIRNRAHSAQKSFKDVCLAPEQFSCWNSNSAEHGFMMKLTNDLEQGNAIVDPFLRQCLSVAREIVDGEFIDNVKGAKNYVTQERYNLAKAREGKEDAWILKMRPVVTIGRHVFLVD